MKLAVLFDRLRWEEKALRDSAEAVGMEAELVDAKGMILRITDGASERSWDSAIQRCISHQRGLLLSRALEAQGTQVVNKTGVSELCGNKMATTMALSRVGVPTPRTVVTLSSESAEKAAHEIGFPVVLKPFSGSWGRMVTIVRDPETLRSVVELREELPNPLDHMYYIQQYVKRPPRDIRAVVAGEDIVACVHRNAPEDDWRTNVARGGTTEAFTPDGELRETVLRAAAAVGGGVLGVDAMEGPDGYVVHEVNGTVEFKGAQSAVSWSIPQKIMEYVKTEMMG